MKMLPTELGSAELARLLGVTPRVVTDLAKPGIIERAGRGRWPLEASASSYRAHLREQAAGRGSKARCKIARQGLMTQSPITPK